MKCADILCEANTLGSVIDIGMLHKNFNFKINKNIIPKQHAILVPWTKYF